MELRQRIMFLDHVKRFSPDNCSGLQWVEAFFEAVHHVGERLFADPTNLAHVLAPANGFGKFLKEEICDELPRMSTGKRSAPLPERGRSRFTPMLWRPAEGDSFFDEILRMA